MMMWSTSSMPINCPAAPAASSRRDRPAMAMDHQTDAGERYVTEIVMWPHATDGLDVLDAGCGLAGTWTHNGACLGEARRSLISQTVGCLVQERDAVVHEQIRAAAGSPVGCLRSP